MCASTTGINETGIAKGMPACDDLARAGDGAPMKLAAHGGATALMLVAPAPLLAALAAAPAAFGS